MDTKTGVDPNSMLIWWPKVKDLGIPVPRTVIVPVPSENETMLEYLGAVLDDGEPMPPEWGPFVALLHERAEAVGFPLFMRTDLFSGKHEWGKTCYVPSADDLARHLCDLCYLGELMSFVGFKHRAVVLREFLELDSPFAAPAYEGMPVAREWRYFVRDGVVQCSHFYWPEDAVEQGRPTEPDWRGQWRALTKQPEEDVATLILYAAKVAEALTGYWSVDFARGRNGIWYLIDMATGEASWHPECETKQAMI